MKIEQLIVQHLYKSKNVTLQGIGTLHLNPSVIIPAGNEKDFVMPENAFSFEYDLKAPEDEALVESIVQQTRKIRPLASSDLESYSILAKQFLNIGKPLIITGVGTIQKNQDGAYEFIQGQFVSPKIEDAPKQLTEKPEEPVSFEHESRRSNNKNYAGIILGMVLLALIGAALYYFLFKNQTATEPATEETAQTQALPDTTVKADTLAKVSPDTLHTTAPVAVRTDSNNFKIVIKDYKNENAANQALNRLSKYNSKFMVIKKDSVTYQLALPFKKPVTDTGRIRDSLRIFFGGKPYVLLQ